MSVETIQLLSWLYRIPDGLMFVAAVVIAVRIRRVSPRASMLALIAIGGLATKWLFWIGFWLSVNHLFREFEWLRVQNELNLISRCWSALFVFLLVCAVVTDRRPRLPSQAMTASTESNGHKKP